MAIGVVVLWLDRRGTFLHGIHELEEDLGGVESRDGQGPSVLDLLLHLMAALDKGLGWLWGSTV